MTKVDQAGLEKVVHKTMNYWGIPGSVVSVCSREKELFTKSFGLRDTKNNLPVSNNTVFPIGSITKSFTAAAVALAVDQGMIEWHRPLVSYIPDFKLYDEMAEKRLTITDLLSHGSGLPPHNNFWYGSYHTRHELFKLVKHLEPAWDIRTRFCYQNLNYLMAGAVIEKITGSSWEDYTRQFLLEPLGLNNSSLKKAGLLAADDYALPHKQGSDGEFVTFPVLDIEACAPAGGLNMSIADFMKWATLHLNRGMHEGKKIIPARGMDYMWQVHLGNVDILPFSLPEIPFTNYGLGCYVMPYRGHRMILQGGNIEGYVAALFIFPDRDLAISVMANMHEANLYMLSTALTLADHILGLELINWDDRCMDQVQLFLAEEEKHAEQQQAAFENNRKTGTEPTHDLRAYTGTYLHPGYGELKVDLRGGELKVTHNDNRELLKYYDRGTFTLNHYHYNTFSALIAGLSGVYQGLVSFTLGKDGEVESIAVPFEPEVRDIVFTKKQKIQ